jgi:hypothetical protein
MADREITEFLSGVVGVVEANSYERLCLWQEAQGRKTPWRKRSVVLHETVGHLSDMPVCLTLVTAEIDRHKILFIDPVSQVIDYRLIDNWLADMLPGVRKVDAMNFHNVFPVS